MFSLNFAVQINHHTNVLEEKTTLIGFIKNAPENWHLVNIKEVYIKKNVFCHIYMKLYLNSLCVPLKLVFSFKRCKLYISITMFTSTTRQIDLRSKKTS